MSTSLEDDEMAAEPSHKAEDSPFSFSWAEFSTWFEEIKKNQLNPARATFFRILTAKLDREISQFDRHRIQVTTSRVKSPARTWAKMTKEKYRGRVTSLESIPEVIDDLVGLRVICNNLSDVLRLQEILADLPSAETNESYSLAIEPDSTKDYFESPKESGYRAYHLNLITLVPGFDDHSRVRGELQVRTLLQDGWGELTHEDTYKPGVMLPDLATTIARRMADLLATVDDLAQDLRNELDRLAERAVADDSDSRSDPEPPNHLSSSAHKVDLADAPISTASREALLEEIRRIVGSLTRPAALTDVAQQVQSKFGTDIVRDWAGHTTFKNLLSAAVPDVMVIGPQPGTVIPPGLPSEEVRGLKIGFESEIPALIRSLRGKDRNTPAVGRRKLDQLLREVRDVLTPEAWRTLQIAPDGLAGIREVNKLSRQARNTAAKKGEIVSRQHLDYILKALLWRRALKAGLTLDELRVCLAEHFISRAQVLGIVVDPDNDLHIIQEWLAGDRQ
jgi:ppGpp synthetase/RelA/SpoT-type nucleotidyltranferase